MENTFENKKLELTQASFGYLETTRKWTLFFAILGFVIIGLMIVIGLVAGSLLTSFSSRMTGMEGMEGLDGAKAAGGIASILVFVVILIFAVIYFFPLLFLFRFSRHTKKAIADADAEQFQLALQNMKSYWKYLGIFTIIVLAVYVLVLIIAGGSLAILSGLRG